MVIGWLEVCEGGGWRRLLLDIYNIYIRFYSYNVFMEYIDRLYVMDTISVVLFEALLNTATHQYQYQ